MDRNSPNKPENIHADLIAKIQGLPGPDGVPLRVSDAFEIATQQFGF